MIVTFATDGTVAMTLKKFETLLEKVDALLARIVDLSDENRQLNSLLREREEEIKNQTEKAAAKDRELEQVQAKVDELIERIDGLLEGQP